MNLSLSKLSLLLVTACLILSFCSYAQSQCSCPGYATIINDYEKNDGDSNPYIEKLHSSSNIICIAKSYEWLALEYKNEKKMDTAGIYFQKALELYKQSGCGDSMLLNVYKQWAELYYTKGDFVKAQEYSFKLLQSAEASGSAYETAICFTMIAHLFNQTNQADKGIVYSRKAVPLLAQITIPAHKADLLFKLSKRYLWHYQDTKTSGSLDSSELFSYRQLAIAKEIQKNNSVAAAFSNLQGIAYEKEDYRKALQLLDSSFRYTDSDNYNTLATNYYDKADLLIELKEYQQAERMADSCLYLYREKSGNPAYVAEAYELLSKIGKESGDFKKGYEYNELARNITDSIRNVEKTKQVTELERKYSQVKNEQTIKQLAQQKRIYLLLTLTGLLALTGLIFFSRQQSLKNKQTILEAEQRLNRARINPHFFFNALSSLQASILEGVNNKVVASNVSRFSHIMRETLESTYKEYITIEQENDFLKEYLELQQIRFPEKFSYDIHISAVIETDETLIPAMILQPFIENSIEHGFSGIQYPGKIKISVDTHEEKLSVVIQDNGKGLQPQLQNNGEHVSRASQIIKDRIYLLNTKLKTQAWFSVDNNPDENGVIVIIMLPLLYKSNLINESTGNRQ